MNKITPTHTFDWYIKWVSSIFIIIALLLTSNHVYPANIIFHLVGLIGWFIVGWCWHDRALMALNVVGISIMTNGLIIYVIDVLKIQHFHLLGRTAPYSGKCLSLVGYPMDGLRNALQRPLRQLFCERNSVISKKLATLVKIHIGLDDEGFIRIAKDTVDTNKLRDLFEEELPEWEDADVIVRYTEHIQKNLAELLKDSEKMFNFTDLF